MAEDAVAPVSWFRALREIGIRSGQMPSFAAYEGLRTFVRAEAAKLQPQKPAKQGKDKKKDHTDKKDKAKKDKDKKDKDKKDKKDKAETHDRKGKPAALKRRPPDDGKAKRSKGDK